MPGKINEKVYTAIPGDTAMPDPQDHRATRLHFLKQVELSANNGLQGPIMKTAGAVKVELDRICTIIEQKSPGVTLIKADTKSFTSANRKINDECDGHWLDLKDVGRVTLAANTANDLAGVVGVLKSILVHRDGYTLAKAEETTPAYPPDNKCGYSGFNFVVRFGMKPASAELPNTAGSRQHVAFNKSAFTGAQAKAAAAFQNKANAQFMHKVRMDDAQIVAKLKEKNDTLIIPDYVGRMGEIQVNTFAMMYGKMDRKSFSEQFSPGKWEECFQQTGIEGGFGHIFYEDWREDKASEASKAIANLSCRYYARMRGTNPKPAQGGDALKEEVMAYIAARKPKGSHA
jgi:hypothetical protein